MFKIVLGVGLGLLILFTGRVQAEDISTIYSQNSNPAYEQYKKQLALEDIYIAFVKPSLVSPMSYFGHTFLIFKKHGSWEFSKTFSFSAVIPSSITKKDLITNGALGKLTGRFVIGNFHEFKYEYLEKEQRGISLYRLNLRPAEKNLLIKKSFEVYDQVFSYHFFEQNCSTELIRYLSTARPKLSKKLDDLMIKDPAGTLNLLIDAGLILENDYAYFPKLTHAFYRYLNLNKHSQDKIDTLLSSHNFTNSSGQLSNDEKEVLTKISSLLFSFFNTPPPSYKEFQNQRYTSDEYRIPPLKNDLTHTKPARVSFGLKQNGEYPISSISFMPSHRERFEERFSYVNETSLKTLYAEINFYENNIILEQLDLLELASYNKSFSEVIIPSWRFYTGYNDNYNPGQQTLMSELGYGLSMGTTNFLFSVMPQINIDLTKKSLTSQVNTLVSYWFNDINFSYQFVGNITGHNAKKNFHEFKINMPMRNNYSITFKNEISHSEFGLVLNKRFSF